MIAECSNIQLVYAQFALPVCSFEFQQFMDWTLVITVLAYIFIRISISNYYPIKNWLGKLNGDWPARVERLRAWVVPILLLVILVQCYCIFKGEVDPLDTLPATVTLSFISFCIVCILVDIVHESREKHEAELRNKQLKAEGTEPKSY